MGTSRTLDGFTMSTSASFRLSFHVSHPSLSASAIESVFNLPIKFAQSVGMQRKTKSGVLLEGTHKRTNVNFSLHKEPLDFKDVSVAELINEQLELYDKEFLEKIFVTGGSSYFILGVFSSGNVMFDLDAELMQKLASFKSGIKIDFYGGED